MKKLEIIITILICFLIMIFVVNQSKKIQTKSHNEKVIEQIKKNFKGESIRL